MPVQLPPLRTLPDPEAMLQRILDEERTTRDQDRAGLADRRRLRHRALTSGLLVAAAGIAVASVAVPVALHRADTTAASPSSNAEVSTPAPPTPRPSSSLHPTTGRLVLGSSADLEHVRVTVDKIEYSPSYGVLVDVEVCLRSLPPDRRGDTAEVSWRHWTLVNGEGRSPAELRQGPPGGEPPPLFPRQRSLEVGQCARGWIPFSADEHSRVSAVLYADSLGDTAAWAGG